MEYPFFRATHGVGTGGFVFVFSRWRGVSGEPAGRDRVVEAGPQGDPQAFREFEKAGDRAVKQKGKLVDQIIEALTVHTYLENECVYPRVRELLPDLEDDVLE